MKKFTLFCLTTTMLMTASCSKQSSESDEKLGFTVSSSVVEDYRLKNHLILIKRIMFQQSR
jgi:hypothetical protein